MLLLFDDFQLDTARRELRRDGEAVPLERRGYLLLLHLVRNRHRVVTKRELAAQLWDGRIVCESSLTRCVCVLRKALGDGSRGERMIETVYGEGYRFTPRVRGGGPGEPSGTGDAATRGLLRARIADLLFTHGPDALIESLTELIPDR